ncbi:dihydroxyacetone kinase subunit DhaL [Schaalia sp. lx-100]|uniref:dihydroxyacetone kinase subunit DhaL n=1 Tax=Schaalia sp. lx-100 TaxID=2899081 RepID=UPI001E347ADC|nr:dihydroxyacetone kinase subunit DhaL [Schaalia sp. lx-100]MCD4557106.1 dihydroxyacetone kinase subunit L [Schaalia sp. lx-100]
MTLDTTWAIKWMRNVQADIAAQREYLIDLDRAIGDGDHGENLDRGFTHTISVLENEAPQTVQEVLKIVAKTLMSTVGGAAGPLYGTAFLRAAKAVDPHEQTADTVVTFLQAALEGIQARGKAEEGEKTMVDAWAPAVRAARTAAEAGQSPQETLKAAAQAAHQGAADTQPMQATKGRASYLGERSIGHLDPGAVSSALILNAAYAATEE